MYAICLLVDRHLLGYDSSSLLTLDDQQGLTAGQHSVSQAASNPGHERNNLQVGVQQVCSRQVQVPVGMRQALLECRGHALGQRRDISSRPELLGCHGSALQDECLPLLLSCLQQDSASTPHTRRLCY